MKKIDQQHENISKAGKTFDMSFVEVANDMELRLKKMGIEISHSGPRIPDPGHVRGEDIRAPLPARWEDDTVDQDYF
ncbi:MAG: hypothetical protein OXE59_11910 [Bacteroidetes bacterium]|nr:hypothetical protein [Bacteroidota bacterium]MCY4234426.1 hypothetical protein [Bacteroidota bacterium]